MSRRNDLEDARRKRDLAKIHIARDKELHMPKEHYRNMLSDMFGVDSAADLDSRQRWILIKRLEELGARLGRKAGPDDKQAKKIMALWASLHKAGVVRDGSRSALDKYIMRQVKVRSLEWLSTAKAIAVIESLKKWKEREGLGYDD